MQTPPETPEPSKETLRLEWRDPAELAENPANWRRHPDAQVAALTDVISEVGWAGACLFNERTQRLIDGHARRKVAVAQGTKKVPVLIGNWTDEQERKILATLDPLAAMAETDAAALAKLLGDVATQSVAVQEMLDWLREANPLPVVLPEAGAGGDEFDAASALQGECRSATGDVWLIDGGKHRVMCGDSTKAEDVARLMGGEKVGLCFTSPPYAQQRDYGEKAKEQVQDWFALMCGVFANLPMTDAGQVLVNLGIFYRDGDWIDYWTPWLDWMSQEGWRKFGWYIWDKMNGLPGDWCGRCAPAHEWVFHFNRVSLKPLHIIPKQAGSIKTSEGGSTLRYQDGSMHTMNYSPESGLNTHKIPDSVWRMTRAVTGGKPEVEHPAVYPVSLPSMAMEAWPADVYDPFLGSGTTLIAAHRLGRRCYGMEIEPKYCEVILRRAEAEGLTVAKA